MNSEIPQELLAQVLDAVEALDVIEFIDYHPESIQRDRTGAIRAFCPIHGDTVYRSLLVDQEKMRFRCTDPECGATGDLVELLARARGIDYDRAVRLLIDEFQLDVVLPEEQEAMHRALDEAESYVAAVAANPRNAEHARRAADSIAMVLKRRPDSARALRAMIRLLRAVGRSGDVPRWVARLAAAEERASGEARAIEVFDAQIAENPAEEDVLRDALVEYHVENGRNPEAVDQLMLIADEAELAGNYSRALGAYRRIQMIDPAGLDLEPVITQLLMASGRDEEAAGELFARARVAEGEGRVDEALAALGELLDTWPDHHEAQRLCADVLLRGEVDGAGRDRLLSIASRMGADGRWDESIPILQTLSGAFPGSVPVLERLFDAYRAGGDAANAQATAARLAPLYESALDGPAALEKLEVLVRAHPDSAAVAMSAGRLAERTGESRRAAEYFLAAANLAERAADALMAADACSALAGIEPLNLDHRRRLVNALAQCHDTDAAVAAAVHACADFRRGGAAEDVVELAELGLVASPQDPDLLVALAEALDQLFSATEARRRRREAARALLLHARYDEAEEQSRRVLEVEPEDEEASATLVEALAGKGAGQESAGILRSLAASQMAAGRYQECRDAYRRLVEIDPGDRDGLEGLYLASEALQDREAMASALRPLVELEIRDGDMDAAIARAESLLELEPSAVDAARALVDLRGRQGDREAVADARRQLAESLAAAGERLRAAEVLEDLARSRPHRVEDGALLLELYHQIGDTESLLATADNLCAAANRHGRTDAVIAVLRAALDRAGGSLPGIQERLIKLLEDEARTNEQVAETRDLLARCEAAGEWDRAFQLMEKLLELAPSDDALRRRRVRLLREHGRTADAAVAAARTAARLVEAGDWPGAEASLGEALELDDNLPDAYGVLEQLHVAQGREGAAEGARLRRAAALVRRNRPDEALELLGPLVSADPENPAVRRAIVDASLALSPRDTGRAAEQLHAMAELHEAAGNDDAALGCLREAAELAPDGGGPGRRRLVAWLRAHGRTAEALAEYHALAEEKRAAGAHEEALALLDEGLGMDPESTAADGRLALRSLRAEVLADSGRQEEALAEWRALSPELRRTAQRPPTPAAPVDSPLRIVAEYDFARYIVGDTNRFAWATAQAVAKAPGRTPHNPLFLFADVGLGKTHILHAIANHVLAAAPSARILYTNAEDFTSELIDAIQDNSVRAFRDRHRNVDLLLLDDVHLLAGRERAQEEFFNIFNNLYQSDRQIVVTSDRPPKDIAHLEKRLRSRFGAGVIVDIQAPDTETRIAILRLMARERGIPNASSAALQVLAEAIDTNIRELKGAFNQWSLRHQVGGDPLDEETARRVVEQLSAATG